MDIKMRNGFYTDGEDLGGGKFFIGRLHESFCGFAETNHSKN